MSRLHVRYLHFVTIGDIHWAMQWAKLKNTCSLNHHEISNRYCCGEKLYTEVIITRQAAKCCSNGMTSACTPEIATPLYSSKHQPWNRQHVANRNKCNTAKLCKKNPPLCGGCKRQWLILPSKLIFQDCAIIQTLLRHHPCPKNWSATCLKSEDAMPSILAGRQLLH